MAVPKLLTVEDVERFPDDGYRSSLIRGELYRTRPHTPLCGSIAASAASKVGGFVDERRLGAAFVSCGFVLGRDPDVLLAPHLSFVRTDRLPPIEDWDRFPELAPDLAVEIVSPFDTGPDVADKTREYLAAGVPLVWAIWPKRREVTAHAAGGSVRTFGIDDEVDSGDVLPGFRLPVAKLFP